MSVFTQISKQDLEFMLEQYDVGSLECFKGIEGGTDNSNYFVDTDQGSFVLTIFERLKIEELDFYLSLGEQLHDAGRPVAQPFHQKNGDIVYRIQDKPAVLFQRLTGEHIRIPAVVHCHRMGEVLAEIHSTPLSFEQVPANQFGLGWLQANQDFALWPDAEDAKLFAQVLQRLLSLDTSALNKGVIHADLFHDNALFKGGELGGIIDWYFACNDWYMLDLAILINDWCYEGTQLIQEKYDALLKGYLSKRAVSQQELDLLGDMQLLAAMRFWLSRAKASAELKNTNQEGITVKPPEEFKLRILSLL